MIITRTKFDTKSKKNIEQPEGEKKVSCQIIKTIFGTRLIFL